MIAGLTYPVVWMMMLYVAWLGEPHIVTELDFISSLVILMTVIALYKNREIIAHNFVIRLLQMRSLIYATIWTVIIMVLYETSIAGILLPIDLISLYATITLSIKIWRAE